MIKYKELNDVLWLREQYDDKKLSCSAIASIVGCSKDAIRVALMRHNIPLRTAKESNAINFDVFRRKSRNYSLLNDETWLRDKYLNQKLSTIKIANLAGAKTSNSVRQALLGFNIPLRGISDALTAFNDDNFIFNKSILDGCLLGDGSYRCYNKYSDKSYASFSKKNKFYDHVLFVAKSLFSSGQEERIKTEVHSKGFVYYRLASFVSPLLKQEYERWYPVSNNFKKCIPIDIKIDNKLLLHWFLDDGSTSFRGENGIVFSFCSECFSKENQQMLCDKINEAYPDLKTRLNKIKNRGVVGWRIKLPVKSVPLFFEIVGPSPVQSLKYKWKTFCD